MVPLVDPELKLVDKEIIMLTELNQRLLDAFQLYHDIMSRQNPSNAYYTGMSNTIANTTTNPINPTIPYLPPNTANIYPYTQPTSSMTKSASAVPMNGFTMPTDLNGTVMFPPTDSYPMSTGIYANPQTENFSGNLHSGQISSQPFPVQQFYESNQIVPPDVVTQQMQSYPSGSNNYGVPIYPMNDSQSMVYTDQSNNTLSTQRKQ
ncbi:hypothetical protein MS3_00009732 [Schistosoma haematobium]|nr:hypothetical protein MS3_00009732 [Schistosoma haematobium]KAH9579646.1 hypothetical protein MS3_00009732 [Schistosoma haematobium]